MLNQLKKNLQFKVTCYSFIFIILIHSIFFVVTYSMYSDYVIDASVENMKNSTMESTSLLNKILIGYLKPLNNIAYNTSIKSMDWETQKNVLDINLNGFYDEIAIVNLNGQASYFDGTIIDLSERDYVQKALKGENAVSDKLISKKTGESVIVAALPIKDGHETIGAIMGRLDMESLMGDIASNGFEQEAYKFIISEKGSEIYSEYNDEKSSTYLYDDSIINLLNKTEFDHIGVNELEYKGIKYYISYGEIGFHGWKLYTVFRKYDILEPVRNMSVIITIYGLIFLTLVMGVAYFAIKKTTIPINELARLMNKGANGDFNVRSTINRYDEIGNLSKSFNIMIDKIKTLTYFDVESSLPNTKVFEKDYESILFDKGERPRFGLVLIEVDDLLKIKSKNIELFSFIVNKAVKKLKRYVPVNSVIYKYTDNTFMMLIPDISRMVPSIFEENVSKFLHKLEEDMPLGKRYIMTMGYYFEEESYIDPIEAVTAANQYSKRENLCNMKAYDHSIMDTLNKESEMKIDIAKAISEKEFFLLYQPIVSLMDKKMIKAEALIRWEHPEKGLIMPDDFITIAESSDLIIDLDYYVIESVCRALKDRMDKKARLFEISINVTSKTFESEFFVEKLKHIIDQYEIDAKYLELEITERIVMNNFVENIEIINKLKKMAIKITLDDFGIGYSSLSYLVKIPLDIVKIDKSFIDEIDKDDMDRKLVKSIIEMCKNLELTVVAEGIETKEEADFLLENSCFYGQGYLFSKPVKMDQINKMIM